MKMRILAARLVLLASLASVALGDLYMHNPPGSNDRNRERNDNRNNANRMFDSQNNAQGGYPWRGDATVSSAPDPISYYVGSALRVEWTAQHACGPNPNIHCQLIMQYMCEADTAGLRDGYPEGAVTSSDNNADATGYTRRQFSGRGGQNDDGTNRIPTDQQPEFYNPGLLGGIEYGYHETIASYQLCTNTQRNKGLYTADQQLNGNDARFTRQNPNGGRSGLECPEERDYYPYWRPTGWHDVALLVSDQSFCPYYQQKSENVAARSYCDCSTTCQNTADNQKIPISAAACTKNGGTWRTVQRTNEAAPTCTLHGFSRDNHLGNVAPVVGGALAPEAFQPETAHHVFNILPQMAGAAGSQLCVLRLRYNMSTGDYPDMTFTLNDVVQGVGFDSSKNCPRVSQNPNQNGVDDGSGNTVTNPQCTNALTLNSRPLYNRPYVKVFDAADPALSLALNTHQTGRTFQDRSYVFRVEYPPSGVGAVYNLNVRGRRGNIVQAYPAVEYDFVPTYLTVNQGDFVHIQVHGSDFNAPKNNNNGEGWRYSDRSNVVQAELRNINYPLYKSSISMFNSVDIAKRWALLEQDPATCKAYKEGDANEQNAKDNCGKLNSAPARYPKNPASGLVKMNSAGTFTYFSSRNNNFSNRSQKAQISVAAVNGLSSAEVAGIVIGSIAGAALLVGGVCFYGKKNPNSVAGGWYSGTVGRLTGGGGGGGHTVATSPSSRSAPAPDMEYQRH